LSFTTAGSSSALLDTTLPFSSSSTSTAALSGGLIAPDSTFYDWNLPLSSSIPPSYPGGTHTPASAPGLSSFDMTPGVSMDSLSMLPITTTMYDSSQSSTMDHATLPTPASSDRGVNLTSLPTSPHQQSSSPEMRPASKASTKATPSAADSSRIEKRKANTLAARRYRQKRVDQVTGLEAELKEVKAERDDMKVRCAKLEGEVEALRALLRSQK
jgi:hypothetical protein